MSYSNITYLPKVRPILFWDTDFYKIDWERQKSAVIKRIKERGNAEEKKEIANFYNINPEDTVNSFTK